MEQGKQLGERENEENEKPGEDGDKTERTRRHDESRLIASVLVVSARLSGGNQQETLSLDNGRMSCDMDLY